MTTHSLARTTEPRAQRANSGWDMAQSFTELVMHQLNPSGAARPASGPTRTLQRGQHLYWPGDTPASVYLVYRGTLKTYRICQDCSERITGFHFPGEILGLDAVIDRPVRTGAVALDEVTVCLIPAQALTECLQRSEAMRAQLLQRFGDEISRLEEHLSLDSLSAEQRLAAFIVWVVGKFATGSAQPAVLLPMSHKEVGNYLRLVPETVSRQLARFQQRGWLTVRRRVVTVRDLEQMRQAAGGGPDRMTPAAFTTG